MDDKVDAIIGLGNPGERYRGTRHNVGYMVADLIVSKFRGKWKSGKGRFFYSAVKIGGETKFILRSATYMNESGLGALDAALTLDIPPQRMLVVLDDFALPFGEIRIRKSGSDGGHRGLASVIYHLNTQDIPRLRVGIGPVPEDEDNIDFVLSDFTGEERNLLEDIIRISADAAVLSARVGLQKAMEKYNRKLLVGEKSE